MLPFLAGDLRWRADMRKGVLMLLFIISWKLCFWLSFTPRTVQLPLFPLCFRRPKEQLAQVLYLFGNVCRWAPNRIIFTFVICGPFAASCCLNSEVLSGHLAWLSVLHPNCVEFAALCSSVQLGWCSRVLLWVLEPVLCFDWKELVWLSGFFIHANTTNCHSSYWSITSSPVCLSLLGQCASAAGLLPSPVCCCWQPCSAPLLLHLLCTGKNDSKLFTERGWSFSSSSALLFLPDLPLVWASTAAHPQHPHHRAVDPAAAPGLMLGALRFGGCAPRSDLNRAVVLALSACVEMSRALETSSEGILHSQLLVRFPSPYSKQIVLTDKSRIMVRRFARQQDYGS